MALIVISNRKNTQTAIDLRDKGMRIGRLSDGGWYVDLPQDESTLQNFLKELGKYHSHSMNIFFLLIADLKAEKAHWQRVHAAILNFSIASHVFFISLNVETFNELDSLDFKQINYLLPADPSTLLTTIAKYVGIDLTAEKEKSRVPKRPKSPRYMLQFISENYEEGFEYMTETAIEKKTIQELRIKELISADAFSDLSNGKMYQDLSVDPRTAAGLEISSPSSLIRFFQHLHISVKVVLFAVTAFMTLFGFIEIVRKILGKS